MTGSMRPIPDGKQREAFKELYESMQDCYPKPSWWRRLRNRFQRKPKPAPCTWEFTEAQLDTGMDLIKSDGSTCICDETPDK